MRIDDLLLDVPTPDDLESLHRIYSDPRVWTHFPSGCHADPASTAEMIQNWVDGWERDGLSHWLVSDAESGALLGHVGCDVRRGAFWNLGYRLAPEAQGRGIATRVGKAAADRAVEVYPTLPVIAYLLEHNRASARVAEKLGLTLKYRAHDAGNPDPEAIRLIYADRDLRREELDAALQ